jgi:hypothetical protein
MVEATNAAADWNVIVTLPEAAFREARKFLRRWGEVHRTGYFHVLTMLVEDVESFLTEVAKAIEGKPSIFNILSHIIPAQRTFTFASAGSRALATRAGARNQIERKTIPNYCKPFNEFSP